MSALPFTRVPLTTVLAIADDALVLGHRPGGQPADGGRAQQHAGNADQLAEAAGSVALLFCSVNLFSGMIWGHSAWNTFWRWEPRLVSFLLLWLILLSQIVLRLSSDGSKARTHQAVLGIVASVLIPVVIFSVKLLPQTEQLHPQVVQNEGLRDARFVYALVSGIIAMTSVGMWLFQLALTNGVLRRDILDFARSRPVE